MEANSASVQFGLAIYEQSLIGGKEINIFASDNFGYFKNFRNYSKPEDLKANRRNKISRRFICKIFAEILNLNSCMCAFYI